jgi:Protein of unknown function (DUF3891)
MIRSETDAAWILVTHPDHARIAGEFADAWGNERFARPEPYEPIRHAVYHHDDGWLARDAAPLLTREGKPEAFTSALVGAYSAFEEIDLPAYLRVRAKVTAEVAAQDAYAGIVVSMHTYNLLTEQADASTIRAEHRSAYETFLADQLAWQRATVARLGAGAAELHRAFEFLQCCDNLSLIVCSGYAHARELRHTHPDRDGVRHAVRCEPLGGGSYRLSPWPLSVSRFILRVPYRVIAKRASGSVELFRAAFAAAPVMMEEIVLTEA